MSVDQEDLLLKKRSIKKLNREIKDCRDCGLYRTRKNAVCGEGNLNAKLMLVAQAPGKKEDEAGRMFIGSSGKVLDELLSAAGVKREEIYMTNLIKCMLPKYRRPKPDEIAACSKYLDREIEIVNPEVLVPLGYYPTRYLFEKYSISLPPGSEFASICGKLFLAGDRKILPLEHPASLLYDDSIKDRVVKHYRKLKVLLTDCKWYPVCPMRRFYEKGVLDRKWIELYCKGDWESCVRYQMEEKGEPHPDWMLPDGTLDKRLHKLATGRQ